MVDNGYGLFYNIREDDILFTIVSKKSNEETNAVEYANAIEKSLEEMHAMLEVNQKLNSTN